MHDLNEEINFEFDDRGGMDYNGHFRAYRQIYSKSISHWASRFNSGEIQADPTEYELDDPKGSGKKIRRIPDVSYISYETASEEVQDNWDGFIPIPPNMAMEIVSAKYGLKGDVELKAVIQLEDVHLAQALNYLKACTTDCQ